MAEEKEVSEVVVEGVRTSNRKRKRKSTILHGEEQAPVAENQEDPERFAELFAMDHLGISGPLLQHARNIQVPRLNNFLGMGAKHQLVKAILKREKEIAEEAADQKAQRALLTPNSKNLEEWRERHLRWLAEGEITPWMRKNWHACFCYAQFVWLLKPSSYGRFCDEHFDPVLQLGCKVTLEPAFTALLSNLRIITIRTGEVMTFNEMTMTDAFKKEFPDYDEDKYKTSFNGDRLMPKETSTLVILPPIDELLDIGIIDSLPNSNPGYTKKYSKGRNSNQNQQDQLNESLNENGFAKVPENELVFLLHTNTAILKHLLEYSTAEKFNDFKGESAQCICIRNVQGSDLTSSKFVYAMLVKNAEYPIFFVTDQRYFFTKNDDRFSEELLSEPFFNDYVRKRGGGGLISHAVDHSPVANANVEVTNAINAYALFRLDNIYRKKNYMEPLELRPLCDHPALHDQDAENMEKRIENRMEKLSEEFRQGVWSIDDIHRSKMIENAFSSNPNAPSPWVVCTKGILT